MIFNHNSLIKYMLHIKKLLKNQLNVR